MKRLTMVLSGLVIFVCLSGCGSSLDETPVIVDSTTAGSSVLLRLSSLPEASEQLRVSFLHGGNTIESRSVPANLEVLLDNVSGATDEVYVAVVDDGRVVAESYAPVTVAEQRTVTVEANVVERECLAPEGVAKEIIDQLTSVTVIAGGDNSIPEEQWEVYTPSPPFAKNSDRFTMFTDSCLFRSFDASWDAPSDQRYTFINFDGYSWLRLARALAQENLPATETTDRVPPPGHVQIIVIQKCQELVFTGQIYDMHDPYGNVYVMHANPDGQPDRVTPTLPPGWHIETRTLTEPLVLNPRGKECRYTLVKDDQDQGYHQYVFDGLEGLSQAVSPETAAYLDEN
jgi:hypothetical protein